MSAKTDFLELAKEMERSGITDLLEYLENETDFFSAPASSIYRGACESGLLLHSLSVYDIMREFMGLLELDIPRESIIVCGLFHDVCKINFYHVDDEASQAQLKYMHDLCDQANIKTPDKSTRTQGYISQVINALKSGKDIPPFKPTYKVNDQLPTGHGEKSVFIINKFMPLTDVEALAIRWHLGGFDPGVNFAYPSGLAQKQAIRENKLVALLTTADLAASYLVDTW